MKHRFLALILSMLALFSLSGCRGKKSTADVLNESTNKQKMVVVVVDKDSKAAIKDAKVNIIGDDTVYTTDEMGKTPEVLVDLNKGFFLKYSDEVTSRVNCGFINIAAAKQGYGKHMEVDSSIYPGDSTSLVRIELTKNKDYTYNVNAPDISYMEALLNAYEKFSGEGLKTNNMAKAKITVTDEMNRPVEGAKIVIPESKVSVKTNKSGTAEVSIPYDNNSINMPVKKVYGEITVLIYKDKYAPKAVIKKHISVDKPNNISIKLKNSSKCKCDYEVVKPDEKWMRDTINFYKQ